MKPDSDFISMDLSSMRLQLVDSDPSRYTVTDFRYSSCETRQLVLFQLPADVAA